MRKFRINELSSSNDGVSTSGQQHHGMQSPSALSLASPSTSINHQTPDLRQSLASNNGNNSNNNNAVAANMVHSSTEPQRANQYYHHDENHFIFAHNDNINWRDVADGSEEEECRLNWLSGSSDLPPPPPPPQNLQSNLFGQHSLSSNLLTHPVAPVYSAMSEQDLRTQGLNNSCPIDSARVGSSNTDKNLDSNFKEKQLRETEFCINRIEDLLSSFKNLWKTNESVQVNGNGPFDGHVNNLNANLPTTSSFSSAIGQRKPTQTVPKMINNSNAFNHSQSGQHFSSRVSNIFGGFQASTSTIPKNTQQTSGSVGENLRNSKNTRKLFGNNRRTVQSDSFQPLQMNETDFNEPLFAENAQSVPEGRIDQFYRLLNAQINTLHSRLEQLALSTDNSSKESYSQTNPFNFNESLPSNNPHYFSCDIENCCVPSLEVHESGLVENWPNDHQRRFNQQIYQLLMLQNYQINQQHKLIESWLFAQQKWIEKQPCASFKPTPSGTHSHAHTHRHSAFGPVQHGNQMFINENPLINNYRHAHPDITLNNLTEPRSRANNFFDNFRSHTHQNKLQPNRESIAIPPNREHQFTGSHHGNNCSNSCINMNGPCNKNSRSQFFSGFGAEGAKSQPNVFITPNHHGTTTQQQLSISSHISATPSTSSMLFSSLDKKQLNTTNTTTTESGGNNNQLFSKTMIGKAAETDTATHTKANLSSSSRQSFTSPLNASSEQNNSSHKRKKTSNVSSVDPSSHTAEHPLLEDDCEFNVDEEDDHDSIDMEPSVFDSNSRISGNSLNDSSIFGASSSLANSIGIPTSLPSGFHHDKCSFQVPLTILPHTGAIRKKPMYDNFKFAATDNQKLSVMQHHTPKEKGDVTNGPFASANFGGIANENIRPLMPAEGRSSEHMQVTAPSSMVSATVAKPKLPSSLQKFSTRPPIAGAGNEMPSFMSKSTAPYAHSSHQDSLVSNVLDDDIKWNQLNGSDTFNNGDTDLMAPSSSNEVNGHKQTVIDSPSVSGSGDCAEMVSRAELSSTSHLLEDERLLDGSTEPEPSSSPSKSKSKDDTSKCEPSFLISSSGLVNSSQSSTSTSTTGLTSLSSHNHNNGATSAVNKSISLAETEKQQQQQQHNATNSDNNHNAASGRFLPDEVIRVNGHHQMEGDGDLEEDKDTDVRLLSLTNAVEVRSTVRLSGDGEQGL